MNDMATFLEVVFDPLSVLLEDSVSLHSDSVQMSM